jgi:hypothetical protein
MVFLSLFKKPEYCLKEPSTSIISPFHNVLSYFLSIRNVGRGAQINSHFLQGL